MLVYTINFYKLLLTPKTRHSCSKTETENLSITTMSQILGQVSLGVGGCPPKDSNRAFNAIFSKLN